MKKTLSLLLALVMVIGLFPVFADEAPALTAEEAGAVLQGYGAIKGDSNGDLMIDKELKRQDAVVILTRLMGKDKEVEAMPKETKASFEDITIDYYQPFLAFAESNKWIEGKAEKKFGFNDVVTVKEFSAMLLRALGHDTMGENYAKVMDLAKEQGLFKGAMVEENANLVRGIAFILMNNTLETAPKGEDKALVYKLGYKEEPKPENLTVVSAEAAGLKAIDVKFSKEVDENTLKSISVKEKKSIKKFEAMLLDGMTARLVLEKEAKQDAKYDLVIDAVKTVAGEVVEKYEGSLFMTDASRPEVIAVEALNPKTLLVKVSEPINYAFNAVRKLPEFKIEGKALNGKAINKYANEFVVELNSALKPGDYKIEVSGLKDFAGFVAKTAEFDVTVVEDKDAPVVAEAKMVDLNHIKVTFNEGIHAKGTFKVNGEEATPVEFKNGDKELKLKLKKPLDIGAVVEVKVEYKGQKDIMNNQVKDWTTFTFKVEDDATVPEVKEVTVDGKVITITFSKPMLTTGTGYEPKYTILKGGKEFAKGNIVSEWKKDNTVLKLTVNKLNDQNTEEYVLVLEGLKDATVRMNPMPKTEQTITGKDTKAPQVAKKYSVTSNEGFLVATLFFTEEMDEATLLDAKNYVFSKYQYEGASDVNNLRADEAPVTLKVDNGGKNLIIESNDKKVKGFENIKLIGIKDKAGNALDISNLTAGVVEPHEASSTSNIQDITEANLIVDKDGKYQVEVKVLYAIESFKDGNGVLILNDGADFSKLTLVDRIDDFTFYFSIDNAEKMTDDAKNNSNAVSLMVADGKETLSVMNDPLKIQAGSVSLTDKVKPRLTVEALEQDGKKLKIGADLKSIDVATPVFTETVAGGSVAGTITGEKLSGNVSLAGDGKGLTIALTEGKFESGKTYTVDITTVSDKATPDANKTSLKFTMTPDFKLAKFVEVKPILDNDATPTKITGLKLVFDNKIAALKTAGNYTVTINKQGEADFNEGAVTVTVIGDDKEVSIDFTNDLTLDEKTVLFNVEVENDDISDKVYTAHKINLSADVAKGSYKR